MNQTGLDDFLTYQYRRPAPGRAAEALAFASTTKWVADPCSRTLATYCFHRLAQLYPGVLAGYREVQATVHGAAQDFVDEVIASLESEHPWNIFERPIETAADNDLHWAEFCLTGKLEAVHRVIDVLARPDRVRGRLDEWLAKPPRKWLPGAALRRQRAIARLHAVGISCDPVGRRVDSDGDLDFLVALDGLSPFGERYKLMKRALPMMLGRDDLLYIAVKVTAAWSLAGYAKRHPRVLRICRDEVRRWPSTVRVILRQVVIEASRKSEGQGSMVIYSGEAAGSQETSHRR